MQSTKYSNLSLIAFGRFFSKYKKDNLEEKNLFLVKANISMSYEEYYSMTSMNIILGFIISLIFSIAINQIFHNQITTFLLFVTPLLVTFSVAAIFLYLPTSLVNKRGRDIDLFLPYAINFISSMAVAGISPAEIFQTLAKINVYGEVQVEAKKINKEITLMGIDNITALKHAIDVSPSRKFKTFIQGIVGTIQAGSELHSYLSNIAKKYMDDDLIARRKDLDLLEVIAEVLVLSVIAFPIFLVIIVTVMGFFGGSMKASLTILLFFSFVVTPMIYAMFYYLIKSTSIEKITRMEPERKMTLKENYKLYKPSYIIMIFSIIMVFSLLIASYILQYYQYVTLNLYFYWDFMFLALLIIIGPIGIFSYLELKRKKEMQDRLPDFLVEVGDSLATGMTIFDAIKTAEKGNYGKLNPEIKKMKTQLSWNTSMKKVLFDLADRMKTAIVKRIAIVLDKGLMMGGKTSKIFKAAANEVEQINQLEFQRKSIMIIYALVMAVCFFVFLGIVFILYKTIFAEFLHLQTSQMTNAPSALQLTVVDPVLLNYTLYSFVFVQSIGAGLLSGFMIDGKLVSGIRFSCILGIISILTFKLFI